ncbi:DUF4114 domain-containing protein [Scytonema sp. UIC 10036]|uniref:choice-of-anchor L domain-containing protein n=1 Tax=Scytonema sp. UIC 10036 TaxID=2304196 RepID=UPI0012DA7EC7|nr:choice-of-anchor L domain-containing protein [Scytonema sp. UIC 10036]MUG99173.1 DUF4114 domain-containing protein [Scytonema sp. UIC 10036]
MPPFIIDQNNNGSELLKALLGTTKGLSKFTISLIGDGRAFGTFKYDPFLLSSGIVVSTGKVTDIKGFNTIDGGFDSPGQKDLSTDFGFPGNTNDSISIKIDFDADSTAEKLFFQYVFGSEEFVEYGGQFNDSFSLSLNGINLAKLRSGKAVSVNNIVPNPFSGYDPDFIYNSVDSGPANSTTKLDGYTKPFIFEGNLIPNSKNSLVINVKDDRDGLLDSVVFIKGGTLGTVRPPEIGVEEGGNTNNPTPPVMDGGSNTGNPPLVVDGGNDTGNNPPAVINGGNDTGNNPSPTPLQQKALKNGVNNLFLLEGGSQKLRFNLSSSEASFINEVGVFAVNDDQGTINGIRPGQPGYLQTALERSQVVFSALPKGDVSGSNRTLSFDANDTRLMFYLVQNSTTDQVLSDLEAGRTFSNVLFASNFGDSNAFSQVQIYNSGNNSFSLNWEDQLEGDDKDYNDLMMTVELTDTPLALGTVLQGKQEGELVDLRNSSTVQANIAVNSEAVYDNLVGFYTIDDETGLVGNLRPGDAGYAQAALQRNVLSLARNTTSQFNGSTLLAPYIIANGSLEAFLSQNPNNQFDNGPLAYFAYLGANPDKIDHLRLLGDNKFGFEDLFGGGDRDFNDVVMQVNFT